MKTVREMIDDIIEIEGGYVNDPDDNGGETKYGITENTLKAWDKSGRMTIKELRKDEAAEIYRSQYYTRPNIHQLPSEIQPIVFDMCVNHGSTAAIKILQKTMNKLFSGRLSTDGLIGEKTCHKARQLLNNLTINRVVNSIVDERKLTYADIVANNKTQVKFLKGWLNRAEHFRL